MFRYTRANSGLSNDRVTKVMCPRTGEVWAGTESGIDVLKGGSWTSYIMSDTTLKSNWVSDMVMDDSGAVYVGMRTSQSGFPLQSRPGGVMKFDGRKWESLLSVSVNALAIDSANRLWAATESEGLEIFNQGIWSILDSTGTPLRSLTIADLEIAGDGRVFAGLANTADGSDSLPPANGGLYEYSTATWKKIPTSNSPLPSNTITALALDKAGKLWVGGNSGVMTLSEGRWESYSACSDQVNTTQVLSLAVDGESRAWIGYGTQSGAGFLCQYGPAGNRRMEPPGYSLGRVFDIDFDSKQNAWFVDGQSLLKYDSGDWTIFGDSSAVRPIPRNPGYGTYNVAIGASDKVWFTIGVAGRSEQEIVSYDGSVFTNYNHENSPLLQYRISDLRFEKKTGFMLAASDYAGVFEFNGTAWRMAIAPWSPIPSQYIRLLGFDRAGRVLATIGWDFGGGLYIREGGKWTSLDFSNYPMPRERITAFVEDEAGNYWLGTSGGGLIKILNNPIPVGARTPSHHLAKSKTRNDKLVTTRAVSGKPGTTADRTYDLRGRRLLTRVAGRIY